jgi:hypothetical protein
MSKFSECFSEPQAWEGCYVLSREHYTREEAAQKFAEYVGRPVKPEHLMEERVRYGLAPEWFREEGMERGWFAGAEGKGSKAIWELLL